MKTTFAFTSTVLALMSSGGVLAEQQHHHHHQPSASSIVSITATATGTAYPTASGSSNSTYGSNTTTSGSPITAGSCGSCEGVCVTFGATDSDLWYWFNGGPGGDPSDFKSNPLGSVCLTDAGAMFVAGTNPEMNDGGNTKFEWSVGATTSNFDVSVCDGFSVPMVCTGFGGNETSTNTIGGGTLCDPCPAGDQNGDNCRNLGAHTGVLAEVPSCFLEGAGTDGEEATNNYWYYDNISVQAIFTDRTDIVCTVGAIDASSSKAKRNMRESSAAALKQRASQHRHEHQRRAAHGHGLHAIS